MIRPTFPLTWDTTVFNFFDTSVTKKKNMLPEKTTPFYAPNAFIVDTLKQAYLDAINYHMSPIRLNQAGYLESDKERQFYFIGNATTFEIVDVNGKSFTPAITGNLKPSGRTTSSDWTIIAGTNAATGDQKRYRVDITGQSGKIMIGNIPQGVPTDTRLRIKVGNDISSTFIVSDLVYTMVKDAAIKFYGINRSGYGDSWFHPASHTKDGAGGVAVTDAVEIRNSYNAALAGTLQGGYYDCGDHLKESQTQMYAFMAAAVMAATNPDADVDHYKFNHAAGGIDGIPDVLREAKHGADFILRSFIRAKGVIDDMALSIGTKDSDHGWWGRPEYQDDLPVDGSPSAKDRGGPASRMVRLGEIGANIGGETAAGLAILSKMYRELGSDFDAFADSCLMVAEKMYDMAKALAQGKTTYDGGKNIKNNTKAAGWSSKAYNGNNEFYDDLALASVALLYATGKKQYADDMIRTRNLVSAGVKIGNEGQAAPTQEYMENCAGCFQGGWFVTNDKGFLKNVKTTSWANSYTFALYALYKLILADKSKAMSQYGLTEEEWLNAVEDCIANLIYNVSDMSEGSGNASIELPAGSIMWKPTTVRYDADWYNMGSPQGEWIYNRYQAGNMFDVLAYVDVAKSIEAQGISLPIMGTPNWKSDEMYQLAINQINYMLGVNPWDISFIYGVGDKNDAHPHHRASNPEGTNVAGSPYPYKVPAGAFLGGIKPGMGNSLVPKSISWEDYEKSEVCIDASATFLSTVSILAHKFDKTIAPEISVEIRHKSADSAIVTVNLTQRGTAVIHFGTTEGEYNQTATDGALGIQHDIILRDLTPGTTYYFYVTGANAYKPENVTTKFRVDSTQAPYFFTTISNVESAEIANVTVCNVSADSAEIMWYTPNGEYESKVYWDTVPHSTATEFAYNTGAGNADISGIPTQFHYVKIGGLKEKTTYYFMVESNGAQTTVDDENNRLKFTTPVAWYNFSVKTYQYNWSDMSMLNINVFNNEGRPFDSLTIRLYMRGTDEIDTDIGMGTDICNAYDESGFSGECTEATKQELERNLRDAHPIKIEDTYDEATGTWQWYFPLNLGSTVIKSSSRLRFDVRFDHRSPYPPYKDLMNEAPKKKLYCKEGNKWYSPTNIAGATSLAENPGDWSWMPHSRANGEELDYPGMPCISKDEGDSDFDAAPVNPYVSVYRKDQFIWGYSPSKKEMETKRANYKINMVLDPPFNVSNGSHIDIDQKSSTVHVTGKAHVSEGGYITKIWANGVKVSGMAFVDPQSLDKWILDESGTKIIAKYDIPTDMWDLDIPVKMSIGSKKVDITVFAGPNPTCETCVENGGCAFENRNYYVNFSKEKATESQLVVKDANGKPIVSPANPEGTVFYIDLMDKDKVEGKTQTQSLDILVTNNKKNDVLKVTLKADPANPGHFIGGPFTAINHSKESRNQTSEISFFAGDTIQIVYTDPDDEDDVSKSTFYAETKTPSPQTVLAEDTNCDNKVDQLKITFSNKLADGYTLDSIKFFIDGMADSSKVPLAASAYADKNEVIIPIDTSLVPTSASPSGKITTYISDQGTPNAESAKITDGIFPTLESVSILEKADDNNGLDTVMIAFSEPVILSSESEWPLAIAGATGVPAVIGKGTTTNNGKSWTFVISGNNNNTLVPIGVPASIKTTGSFTVTDQSFNPISQTGCKPSVPVTLISRPVPIYHAEMIDIQGDGIPDKVYIMFERKLKPKDIFDSIAVNWGNPSITRTFVTTADTTGGSIKPKENYWTIRDSVSAPFKVMLADSTTKDSVNTYSIIEINIPERLAYPYGSTSGEKDGNGTITPLKGVANGFFESTYTLYDKCAPVIANARIIKNILTINVSEPVSIAEQSNRYIQRERDEYIPSEKPQGSGKSYIFTYNEKENVIHAGDRIRLVPQELGAAYIDKNGNIPTKMNPYVRVTGDDNIRFTVTLTEPVATPKETAYMNRPETVAKDIFVTSAIFNGKNNFISKDGAHLGQADTANYVSSGPNFDIEITMPSASFTTHKGQFMYDYRLKIVMDLFDNLGQYVNTYTLDIPKENFASIRNFVENGLLKLNLEWTAKDNEAPIAKEGNKIGTGAYIAKFDFTAEAFCAATFDETSNDYKAKCDEIGHKVEKSSDNKTKTLGFKRRN